MTLVFQLGPSSATAVTLRPEYDYAEPDRKIESRHRTLSAKEYVYRWSSYERFEFSVQYVPAGDAAIVNSWWDSNTNLLFFITSDSTTEVHSVRLGGEEKPLTGFNPPYHTYRQGKILLEGY